MSRKIWEVWTETEGQDDVILFTGSHADCLKYYKKHGGEKSGLHVGYPC
jgi:hypothetical protein